MTKQEDKQCLYWQQCGQVKVLVVCMKKFTKCIIYQRMKVLDKTKPRTGSQRFKNKWGNKKYHLGNQNPSYQEEAVGIGGMTEWIFDPDVGAAVKKESFLERLLKKGAKEGDY